MENTMVSNKDVAEFLRDSVLQMSRNCKRKAILLLIACGILQCGSAVSVTGWQVMHGSMVVTMISLLACAGYIAIQKLMIEDKTFGIDEKTFDIASIALFFEIYAMCSYFFNGGKLIPIALLLSATALAGAAYSKAKVLKRDAKTLRERGMAISEEMVQKGDPIEILLTSKKFTLQWKVEVMK